jgi:flagellar hook-length control protein FliK
VTIDSKESFIAWLTGVQEELRAASEDPEEKVSEEDPVLNSKVTIDSKESFIAWLTGVQEELRAASEDPEEKVSEEDPVLNSKVTIDSKESFIAWLTGVQEELRAASEDSEEKVTEEDPVLNSKVTIDSKESFIAWLTGVQEELQAGSETSKKAGKLVANAENKAATQEFIIDWLTQFQQKFNAQARLETVENSHTHGEAFARFFPETDQFMKNVTNTSSGETENTLLKAVNSFFRELGLIETTNQRVQPNIAQEFATVEHTENTPGIHFSGNTQDVQKSVHQIEMELRQFSSQKTMQAMRNPLWQLPLNNAEDVVKNSLTKIQDLGFSQQPGTIENILDSLNITAEKIAYHKNGNIWGQAAYSHDNSIKDGDLKFSGPLLTQKYGSFMGEQNTPFNQSIEDQLQSLLTEKPSLQQQRHVLLQRSSQRFSSLQDDSVKNGSLSTFQRGNTQSMLQTFGQNISQQTSSVVSEGVQHSPSGTSSQNALLNAEKGIIDQVIFKMGTVYRSGGHNVLLQLHPPELGKLRIELMSDRGKIRAHLHAQNEQAHDIIQKHLPKLRDSLENEGIVIEEFQVDVASDDTRESPYREQYDSIPSRTLSETRKSNEMERKDPEMAQDTRSLRDMSAINLTI